MYFNCILCDDGLGFRGTLLDIMAGYASWLEAGTRNLTLYSPTPQQSLRQWRPFANDNEASAYKSW